MLQECFMFMIMKNWQKKQVNPTIFKRLEKQAKKDAEEAVAEAPAEEAVAEAPAEEAVAEAPAEEAVAEKEKKE